jgi:hypothetical protein
MNHAGMGVEKVYDFETNGEISSWYRYEALKSLLVLPFSV